MSSRRSHGSHGSHGSRSSQSPPTPPVDVLENVRVLEQSRDNPYDTPDIPPTSRTFRVAVFALNLGLSMLESPRGRQALEATCEEIWKASGRRDRRGFVFQEDATTVHRFVKKFLSKCRTDPPNIIVSDRITGEGLAQRVDWPTRRGGASTHLYTPKWGALFRVNKTLIDNAILIAGKNEDAAFQKFLFLLSVAIAHELVHVFVGFMVGDPLTITPPPVNEPRGSKSSPRPGESGHYWEMQFLGYRVEAYYDENDPLEAYQPGIFYAIGQDRKAFTVHPASIDLYVNMNFADILQRRSRSRETGRIPINLPSMQRLRVVNPASDYDDLTEYFEYINGMRTHRIGSQELSSIMQMANYPDLIRPTLSTTA